jgi:hypothetical protein
MLKARWKNPPWRNMYVTGVHGWSMINRGLKANNL